MAVLDALHAAKTSVGAEQEPQREAIHAGALPTVAPDLLPPALAEFRQRHPHVRVNVQTATNAALLQMLKAGEVDFALARMARVRRPSLRVLYMSGYHDLPQHERGMAFGKVIDKPSEPEKLLEEVRAALA